MAQSQYTTLVAGLRTELERQRAVVDFYERYYLGQNRPAYSSEEWKRMFGDQFSELTANWCQLVVDAAAERLNVTGFTFPALAQGGTDGADPVAQEIWETNQLGSLQARAHTTAVYAGRSYVIVDAPESGETVSRMSIEHPSQVYVRMDPAREGNRLAAIKAWREIRDDGSAGDELITLYLPEATYRLRQRHEKVDGQWTFSDPEFRDDERVDEIRNTVRVVQAVPLENRPLLQAAAPALVGSKILLGGMSDLMTVPPIQDAIDKSLADLMVNGEFVGYPQRYAIGVAPPIDPVTKKPVPLDEWKPGRDRIWMAKDKEAKFGEFRPDDGVGIIKKVELLVQQIAAFTRTPPHYLLGALVNTSGDALKAAEAGLVQRIKAKQGPLGNGWEQATRIACGYMGDMERFRDRRCAVSWGDAEVRTEGEAVDAAMKLYQGGMLPLTMVLERLNYTPQQVERAISLLGMPDRVDPANPGPSPARPASGLAQDASASAAVPAAA